MPKRRRPAARRTGCPCGGDAYESCCGPVHADPSHAATPEALMRSRYTAYVRGDVAHLAATWHDEHRPEHIGHDGAVRWLDLQIVDAPAGDGDTGEVEFVARFRRGGVVQTLHERSRFESIDGTWLYTDGRLVE